MKTILLSFSNEWYPALKDGEKIYEHRKRFCKEKVTAYLYIGYPVKKVVAIITLDKRIPLEDWLIEYSANPNTCARVQDFMTRNKYAMPILDYQEIQPISLEEYKTQNPKFIVPRSYYILENNPSLKEYLELRTEKIGKKRTNNFDGNMEDIVCTY